MMSRWKDEYEKFKQSDQWIAVVKHAIDAKALPDDDEIKRFIKMVECISGLIESLNSEIFPHSKWTAFKNNIQDCHINILNGDYVEANNSIDSILAGLSLFVKPDVQLINAIGNSASSYTSKVNDLITSVNEQNNTIKIIKSENEIILNEQKERYETLIQEINIEHSAKKEELDALLHGATSVGLARAYSERRIVARKSVIIYTIFFVAAVFSLFGIYLYGMYYLISLEYELYSKFIENFWNINHWGARSLILAPLIGTISWLAIFFLKRRSEYFRLEEEYAHKEALATSYESYRKQINELNEDKGTDTGLLEKLINVSIDAIKFKPAETLNKKRGWIGVFEEWISRGKHSKCSNDQD